MNTNLTNGSIKKYFSLGGKFEMEVNDILQVIQAKEIEGKIHGEIYSATLSDSVLKFERFFLPKKLGGSIKIGDLINIKVINKALANGKVFFKVLKFEVIGFNEKIIGNPNSVDQDIITQTTSDGLPDPSLIKKSKDQIKPPKIQNNKPNIGETVYISDKKQAEKEIESSNNNRNFEQPTLLTRSSHMMLSTLSTFTKDLIVFVRCVKKSEKKSFKNNKG